MVFPFPLIKFYLQQLVAGRRDQIPGLLRRVTALRHSEFASVCEDPEFERLGENRIPGLNVTVQKPLPARHQQSHIYDMPVLLRLGPAYFEPSHHSLVVVLFSSPHIRVIRLGPRARRLGDHHGMIIAAGPGRALNSGGTSCNEARANR